MKRIFNKAAVVTMLLIFATVFSIPSTVYGDGVPSVNEEMRAVWLTTVYNLDWPSTGHYNNIEAQKSSLVDNLKFIKGSNMNTVFFQVRGMGDALYPSNYSPWSKYLTGVRAKNPGYDPLKFAVEETHRLGLEFHAWFNPFRIDTNSNFNKDAYINSLPAGSPLKSNSQWIVKYGDYHWLNIGIPEVRAYVIDIILEVVNNYDINGVHIDDYFYPYPISGIEFPDSDAYTKYGQGYTSIADWRRDNVNKFVKELNSKIKSAKSYVKFGISPFGVWRNGTSVGGSATNSFSPYDSIYADSRKWVIEEWIDYIVPQVYWEFNNKFTPYAVVVDWWAKQVEGKKVQLYIGHAAYKNGEAAEYGQSWSNPEEIPNQIRYGRANSNVKGGVFFGLKDLKANKLNVLDNLRNVYTSPVKVPTMPWLYTEGRGWILIQDKWYYFDEKGVMKTGWILLNGKWFYMENNGAMKIGWLLINDNWYYLDSNGAMRTGWLSQNGNWYYLGAGGEMKTGWISTGGHWYYLDKSGAMKTGWVYTGGKWYYMYRSGNMAANTWIGSYRIGSDGAWMP